MSSTTPKMKELGDQIASIRGHHQLLEKIAVSLLTLTEKRCGKVSSIQIALEYVYGANNVGKYCTHFDALVTADGVDGPVEEIYGLELNVRGDSKREIENAR